MFDIFFETKTQALQNQALLCNFFLRKTGFVEPGPPSDPFPAGLQRASCLANIHQDKVNNRLFVHRIRHFFNNNKISKQKQPSGQAGTDSTFLQVAKGWLR
ncbi:MAG: hypothetical protein D6706_01895 [Chloroflexi bacterium]|nr:MAG: hypothetical protein D6706_01895 [Chloroflexota bacterium]